MRSVGQGLEHLRARRGIAPCRKAEERNLPGLRQWKNALQKHPDDEIFGFVE
jgi:hypothetical protein